MLTFFSSFDQSLAFLSNELYTVCNLERKTDLWRGKTGVINIVKL